jgi:hypothetical protein
VTVTVGTSSFPVYCADTAVSAVTSAVSAGSATGGQPLWFSNAYGLGKAFYLACSFFADYPSADSPPGTPLIGRIRREFDRRVMQEQFAAMLMQAGVFSRARVTVGGVRVPSCDFWVRQFGFAELVVVAHNYAVLYPSLEPNADGVLEFRGPEHTYDIDEGTYLGCGDRLDVHVGRYTFRTFSRLPYRVTGVSVSAPASVRLGDRIGVAVQIVTAGAAAGPHLTNSHRCARCPRARSVRSRARGDNHVRFGDRQYRDGLQRSVWPLDDHRDRRRDRHARTRADHALGHGLAGPHGVRLSHVWDRRLIRRVPVVEEHAWTRSGGCPSPEW